MKMCVLKFICGMEVVMKVVGAAAVVGIVTSISKIFFSPKPCLPYDKLLSQAQQSNNISSNNKYPLLGKIAIVTGATSGLGKEIAINLYHMGATVILASRTPKKMEETKLEITKLFPDSKGTLIAEQPLDTSDLDNVVSFVQWFQSKYSHLHYLINNAGTLYTPPHDTFDPKNPPTSKQGFELAFVTNYLGHFLLTQLLMPSMLKSTVSKARIVNIASSAHITVDGSDLNCQPGPNGLTSPIASRPCEKMSQWLSAYGNNKSAMLIHTKETQLELNQIKTSTDLKILATCPGFTATGMVPDGPFGQFLKRIFFPVEPAVLSPLACLFDDDLKGGSFITNFYNFWADHPVGSLIRRFFNVLSLRTAMVPFIISWVIAFQNSSYGVHYGTMDIFIRDDDLTRRFHEWSKKAVENYLVKFEK